MAIFELAMTIPKIQWGVYDLASIFTRYIRIVDNFFMDKIQDLSFEWDLGASCPNLLR